MTLEILRAGTGTLASDEIVEGTASEVLAVGDERVTLASVRTPVERSGVIERRREHLVLWLSAGRLTVSGPDGELRIGSGAPVLLSADSRYSYSVTGSRANLIRITDVFLRDRIAVREGITIPPRVALRFEQTPSEQDTATTFRDLLREIGPVLFDRTVAGRRRIEFDERLADAVLDGFRRRDGDGSRTLLPTRMDRAMTFIRSHCSEEIRTVDIADAAGLSQRGLQQLFRREADSTPTRVLRAVRLDGARADLLRADPAADTVAGIARRWQFAHLGRFAIEYRARHGEHPSTTLRHGDRDGPVRNPGIGADSVVCDA